MVIGIRSRLVLYGAVRHISFMLCQTRSYPNFYPKRTERLGDACQKAACQRIPVAKGKAPTCENDSTEYRRDCSLNHVSDRIGLEQRLAAFWTGVRVR